MIKGMAVLHITESELARDVHGVLEKVRGGAEVVIEQNNRPVAVIKAPLVKGRNISEVIAAMEASGANATVDEDFARDVEEGIKLHREPWTLPPRHRRRFERSDRGGTQEAHRNRGHSKHS